MLQCVISLINVHQQQVLCYCWLTFEIKGQIWRLHQWKKLWNGQPNCHCPPVHSFMEHLRLSTQNIGHVGCDSLLLSCVDSSNIKTLRTTLDMTYNTPTTPISRTWIISKHHVLEKNLNTAMQTLSMAGAFIVYELFFFQSS